MATRRTNVIPIVGMFRFLNKYIFRRNRSPDNHLEDARHPLKYRMLVGMVDCIFADVAQPDQARIVALNAHLYENSPVRWIISNQVFRFLKVGGGILVSVKANCNLNPCHDYDLTKRLANYSYRYRFNRSSRSRLRYGGGQAQERTRQAQGAIDTVC